ncbi:MAG: integral rane protein-like protein [Hyphomicrobiales bacterium]|nr:integral rane protein-like protein [Hyphomicrobiales bacterium]
MTRTMREDVKTAHPASGADAPRLPLPVSQGPSPDHRWRMWRRIGTGLSVAILVLSVFVLTRTLTSVNWGELRSAIAATSAEQIALASVFTAFSYIVLTGYDALALRQLKISVPYRTTALASFTSYAISFTLGFPLVTAGTVRYWIYSRAGVSAAKVASLTVIAGVTFWLGMALVIGIALTIQPDEIADVNRLKGWVNLLIGLGVLVAIMCYLAWISRGNRRVSMQGLRLELPGLTLTLGQLLLGVVDLCCAAAALYVVLPAHHGLDFISFAAAYVFACVLGIASHMPGGIGAFEATMLKTVPSPSPEALLASLLLFRVLYYVVPFVLALALLGANESIRRWNSLRAAMTRSQDEPANDDAKNQDG